MRTSARGGEQSTETSPVMSDLAGSDDPDLVSELAQSRHNRTDVNRLRFLALGPVVVQNPHRPPPRAKFGIARVTAAVHPRSRGSPAAGGAGCVGSHGQARAGFA
jgi:hypothetical protein